MAHLANNLFLFGGFALILGIVLAISRFFENRRKRAAEFRNYFCSGFERDLFPSNSFGDDDSFTGNNPKFAPIRIRSFSDQDRSPKYTASRYDIE